MFAYETLNSKKIMAKISTKKEKKLDWFQPEQSACQKYLKQILIEIPSYSLGSEITFTQNRGSQKAKFSEEQGVQKPAQAHDPRAVSSEYFWVKQSIIDSTGFLAFLVFSFFCCPSIQSFGAFQEISNKKYLISCFAISIIPIQNTLLKC